MASDASADRYLKTAEALLLQGQIATETEVQTQCYAEAFDLLVRAEHAQPGAAAWKLACISAGRGSAEIALRWMKRAHTHDSLPDHSEIEAHEAFQKFKGQAWFKRFLIESKGSK